MSNGSVKGKIIGAIVGTVLIVGIAGGVLFFQDKLFRSIVAEEVSGTVTATGDSKKGQLTKGEHLYGGDFVEVGDESGLTLCADNTKYLYADPNTSFKIEADSMDPTKNIRIVMESGSTLHEITQKLSPGDTYEVIAPNSSMAVRGTTFRVTVLMVTDEVTYTLTEVTKGEVRVNVRAAEGDEITEEAFVAGESALVRGNEEASEFVINKETGTNKWILDYNTLPTDSIERLEELIGEPQPVPPPEVRDEGEHEHVAGDWMTMLEPTCHSEGRRARYCSICNMEMQSETIATTAHDFGGWTQTEAPGCETAGREVRNCNVCGYEESRSGAGALGHQWILDNTVEPHCQADRNNPLVDGENSYHCERCEATKTETIPCTGHSGLTQMTGMAPQCIYNGFYYYDCSACHYYDNTGDYAYTETIPPTGHDWSYDHEENGEYMWYCGNCGTYAPGADENTPPDQFYVP